MGDNIDQNGFIPTVEDPGDEFVAPETLSEGPTGLAALVGGKSPFLMTREERQRYDEAYEDCRKTALRRLARSGPNVMILYGEGSAHYRLAGQGIGSVASVFGMQCRRIGAVEEGTIDQEFEIGGGEVKTFPVYWCRMEVSVTIAGLGGECIEEGRCSSTGAAYVKTHWYKNPNPNGKDVPFKVPVPITADLIGRVRAHARTVAEVRALARLTDLGAVTRAEWEKYLREAGWDVDGLAAARKDTKVPIPQPNIGGPEETRPARQSAAPPPTTRPAPKPTPKPEPPPAATDDEFGDPGPPPPLGREDTPPPARVEGEVCEFDASAGDDDGISDGSEADAMTEEEIVEYLKRNLRVMMEHLGFDIRESEKIICTVGAYPKKEGDGLVVASSLDRYAGWKWPKGASARLTWLTERMGDFLAENGDLPADEMLKAAEKSHTSK